MGFNDARKGDRMSVKQSDCICTRCFHNYVCEKYNADRDAVRDRCAYKDNHFFGFDEIKVKPRESNAVSSVNSCSSMHPCGESPYKAKHIAGYIILRHNQSRISIQNLRLQYILYAAWIEYSYHNNRNLFNEDFYAMNFGPACLDVYWQYCTWGGMDISVSEALLYEDRLHLDTEDIDFLDRIVGKYAHISTHDLSEWTRMKGSPWNHIYKELHRPNRMIPFDVIRRMGQIYNSYNNTMN